MAYLLLLGQPLCGKEAKLDVMTISCAIGLAGYTAIGVEYVALYDLELSLEEIRGTSVLVAIIIATIVAVDFFGKKLGKAK